MKVVRFAQGAALAGLLSPLTAMAQEKSTDALFTVLAEEGCIVSERGMNEVLAPEGFDFRFVSDTLTALLADGEASMNADNEMHLPASVCPPATPTPSPRDVVLKAFSDNDCTIDEARLADLAPDLSNAAKIAVLRPMIEDGTLTVSRKTATLASDACTPIEQ